MIKNSCIKWGPTPVFILVSVVQIETQWESRRTMYSKVMCMFFHWTAWHGFVEILPESTGPSVSSSVSVHLGTFSLLCFAFHETDASLMLAMRTLHKRWVSSVLRALPVFWCVFCFALWSCLCNAWRSGDKTKQFNNMSASVSKLTVNG